MPVTNKSFSELKKQVDKLSNEISLLKDMNEKLMNQKKSTEESYNLLLDSSPFGVTIVDAAGTIEKINKNAENLFGLPAKRIIGKKLVDFLNPEKKSLFSKDFKKVLNGKSIVNEYEIVSANGKYGEIWRNIVPVFRNGEFEKALAFDLDITEKVKTEELLHLWSTAINDADVAIVVTNIRGDAVLVNPAFTKLTGYSSNEILYKNLRILKSGRHDKKFYENMWRTIISGNVWRGELVNKRKDGTFYIQEQTITPVYNKKRELTNYIAFQQDITSKKESEHQAKLQQEQLIQADKMIALGTLVSGVAHEINNPNNFVMLNVPILQKIWQNILPILDEYYEKNGDFFVSNRLKYSKIKDSVPLLLNGISEGSSRIKKIVQELKDFARKETSDLREEVDINEVIEASITLTSNLINKATKNFGVKFGENIPKTLGNFQRLEQVVINLLENSCQALESNEKGIFIESGFLAKEKKIQVIVRDEGIGIDPGVIKEITDPFFTTKRDKGGTGLGLSVSSKIIMNHGGTLEFESKPGSGTSAIIRLPLSRIIKQ